MKIIEQYHVIEHITPNILQQIEKAGRVCWKSEGKMGCTETKEVESFCMSKDLYNDICRNAQCPYHSAQKFVKMIIKKNHEAMLEFGDIHVRLITNRGVTHELVRHRVGMSYAQESTRYVRYDGGMEFIRPVWIKETITGVRNATAWEKFKKSCENAEDYYCDLLRLGWRPEQAREVLPNSLKTEIMIKGNVRAFRHLFQLRTSKKAHPQIRSLMTNLLIDLKKQIPVVFDDIGGENEKSNNS